MATLLWIHVVAGVVVLVRRPVLRGVVVGLVVGPGPGVAGIG